MYVIFEVGDFSHDGHGESAKVTFNTNVTLEELRELHFKAAYHIGFDIGDICRDYECDTLSGEQHHKLTILGLWDEEDVDYILDWEDVVKLWADIIIYVAEKENIAGFELKRQMPEKIPSIHFYGYDDKGRHLHVPGYGAFPQ